MIFAPEYDGDSSWKIGAAPRPPLVNVSRWPSAVHARPFTAPSEVATVTSLSPAILMTWISVGVGRAETSGAGAGAAAPRAPPRRPPAPTRPPFPGAPPTRY